MKNIIFITCILLSVLRTWGQEAKQAAQDPAGSGGTTETNADEFIVKGNNKRISYVVGIGASYVDRSLWDMPTITNTDNIVKLQHAQRGKSNLSLGIVYTPFLWDIYEGGKYVESVPRGVCFATFINPVTLAKASDFQSSFFDMIDFGVGIGWKFRGNIMIMATGELFSVKQPKEWFINEYRNNDKKYIVNGAPQVAFDLNDNTIFGSKLIPTIGFKVCYTFDIISNFHKPNDPEPERINPTQMSRLLEQQNNLIRQQDQRLENQRTIETNELQLRNK